MNNEFSSNRSGVLYLVSTPIGNLEDITLRAIRILKEVDLIASEDTRHTFILLNHFGIKNKTESYHDYNKEQKTPILINRLLKGENIAIVSDAGTPGVSDPAYNIVIKAIEKNISIVPIPGPTAAISALVVSGLPTDRYTFEGFLPIKKGRKERIRKIADENRTIILYESPHRFLKTLTELSEIMGDRSVAVCRELTKKFEEVIRGRIDEIINIFSQRKIRGEFVLVIKGKGKQG